MKSSVALGDVAKFVNGAAFKPEDWGDEGLPIIRIQNLTDPSKPYNRTLRAVSDILRVRRGDLLVSWSATLGVFTWDLDEDGLLNQHIFRVLPDETKVDRAYFRFALNEAIGTMGEHLHGATMQHVNRGAFVGTRVPLPSLLEQRRIAAILDQADELRTKRRRSLELLDELADSNFASLEAEIESSSGQVCIRDVADIQTGPFGSLLHKEDYEFGSVPIVNPTHIVDGEIVPDPKLTVSIEKCQELAVFALRAGDVVLGRRGEMGRAAVVREGSLPLLCGTGSMILRPRAGRINGEVLATTIRGPKARKSLADAALGATMLNLNQRIVGDISIALPDFDTQSAFANSSYLLRIQRESILGQIAVLDELFAGIQHRAFRGEL